MLHPEKGDRSHRARAIGPGLGDFTYLRCGVCITVCLGELVLFVHVIVLLGSYKR
jgi:hypothetical protein